MMTAGARQQVWNDFDPATSPKETMKAKYHGSDQAWISYKLGPNEKRWTTVDGVFSFRIHVRPNGGKLPPGARIVFFEGHIDPWSQAGMNLAPWVKDHWR
jgi:hypothetical protein